MLRSRSAGSRGLAPAKTGMRALVGAAADLDRAGAAVALVRLRGPAPGRRPRAEVAHWIGMPVNAVLLLALVVRDASTTCSSACRW